jgi:hypothetical protein
MTSSASALTPRRTATFLRRQQRQTQGFREPIAGGGGMVWDETRWDDRIDRGEILLLWIPPGRFWMGSPADELEREDSEGPQHLVQLQGFFLGQTPPESANWSLLYVAE